LVDAANANLAHPERQKFFGSFFQERTAFFLDRPQGDKMIEGTHFQNAYVTRDTSRWVDTFSARADVRKVLTHEGAVEVWTPGGLVNQISKIAFIWVGDLQYELIQPISGADIYSDALPEGDGMKFHHICNRVADWTMFRARVDQQPYPVVLERGGDALKFLYLDTRALLGHYIEYVWMTDESWAQMGGR